MTRRTFRVAALLVAVFALLASSCFTIRGGGMTRKVLGPDEMTKVRVNLMVMDDDAVSANTDTVFLLVGWNDADRIGRAQFDIQGNWGGPYQGKRSDALAADLRQPGACTGLGLDAADIDNMDRWEAWYMPVGIDTTGAALADFATQLRATIKFQRPAAATGNDSAEVIIISGSWFDGNLNNIYDAGELILCSGMAYYFIPFVGN